MTFMEHKIKEFKLSKQVKNTLHKKGYSFLFNINDYCYFKKIAKNEFNKVEKIVNLFIEYHGNINSDFSDYEF